MRGCPYGCEFCVSGTSLWSKTRAFALERVKAEIDYALDRSGHDLLILTDENWGILGQRDVELARFIVGRRQRCGSPKSLYYYTAKIVNEATREIVEIVAPFAYIGQFSMSYQTLNPESRKAIKRVNTSLEKQTRNMEWANARGITTDSEMIFGFPYETLDTFLTGVEALFRAGVHNVHIFQLLLFPGIALNAREAREAHGIAVRYRATDGWYGVYGDGDIVSVEAEEFVASTKWASLDDYLSVRRYQFFAYGMLTYEILLELMQLCAAAHAAAETLIRHLTFADYSTYPALGRILADHERVARAEIKDTAAAVYTDIAPRLQRGETVTVSKPNVLALARVLNSPDALRELLAIVERYVEGLPEAGSAREVIRTYLHEVLPHRVAVLPPALDEPVRFHTRFDYARWKRREFRDLRELLLADPVSFEARVSASCLKNLHALDASTSGGLQKFMDATPRKELLREVHELPS
jgi:hypothetical protein